MTDSISIMFFQFGKATSNDEKYKPEESMINKVEICGVDTSKLPTIPEEEVEGYFKRIQSGDTQAREEFIKGNLRLVLSVIQRFYGRGENLDDLFQVGCIGLVKSIDNFNLDYICLLYTSLPGTRKERVNISLWKT